MTYATVDDLKAVIPSADLERLTDWDGASDAVDDVKLLQALNDATAEINGYIAKKVTLPLADPPDMLRVICRDMAMHRLHANTGMVTEDGQKLRDAAISYLKMVSEGKISIGDETGGDEAQTSQGVVMDDGPDRVMTRDSLGSF